MPKKDTESTESFEIVLRKADQLFNGPPSSRSDLERDLPNISIAEDASQKSGAD